MSEVDNVIKGMEKDYENVFSTSEFDKLRAGLEKEFSVKYSGRDLDHKKLKTRIENTCGKLETEEDWTKDAGKIYGLWKGCATGVVVEEYLESRKENKEYDNLLNKVRKIAEKKEKFKQELREELERRITYPPQKQAEMLMLAREEGRKKEIGEKILQELYKYKVESKDFPIQEALKKGLIEPDKTIRGYRIQAFTPAPEKPKEIRKNTEKTEFKTFNKKTGMSGIEEHHLQEIVRKYVSDPQKVDIESLIDSSLSYEENKQLLESKLNPTGRQSQHYM